MIFELQNQAWESLAAKVGRLPHALLIHGAEGVGKFELAEQLAQLLLCEKRGQGNRPCGACDGCRWFLGGNHPDVRYLEPEAIARRAPVVEEEGEEAKSKTAKPSTAIRIEQVRALADFVNLGSHRGGRRIAIVHPAEDMNPHAANALLKSLEEPPAGAVFLLVSHRPAQLLPTIRSRCAPVPVAIPTPEAARAWLAGQGARDAERWLAFCGGAPLRALEQATGERGDAVKRLLEALAAGEGAVLGAVKDRDELEMLAEILQKAALDRAFAALGGRAKYSVPLAASAPGDARAWLAFARAMGRNRRLARHPLNPKLFAAEMLAAMPR